MTGKLQYIASLTGRLVERLVLPLVRARLEDRFRESTSELAQARDSLQATLASIGDAVVATDTEGKVTLLNGLASALTGWTQEEAMGRHLAEVFTILNGQTGIPVESPVYKLIRDGTTVCLGSHTSLLSRNGRQIPIDSTGAAIRTPDGVIHGVVLIFRDASERRRAERERERVRSADERLVQILDSIQDGFLVVDSCWRVYYLNRRAAELLRRSGHELLGSCLWEVLPPLRDSIPSAELERARNEKVPVQFDFCHEPPNVCFNLRAHPYQENLAIFFSDITSHRHAEAQEPQAQKMEAISASREAPATIQ
ncbi:MAG: PAS domain-containing protein [Acidobacteriia bacterium]|nr:PAS domain-containing protein [Terriglobia bacterium]